MLGKQELVLPSVNMLSAGTEVKGDISTIGDFRIDGTFPIQEYCSTQL